MNGEVHDLCVIALSARKALFEHTSFTMQGSKYIAERKFVFCDGFGYTDSAEEWYRISRKRGMSNIRMYLPSSVKDRSLLGFINTSSAFLAIVQEDGTVLRMDPEWSYLKNRNAWRVIYRESEMNLPADQLPAVTDQTEQLKTVLTEIRELALAIKEPFFADCFQDAYDLLEGNASAGNKGLFSGLPQRCGNILNAVSRADVFGAMGSWNDSPPYESRAIGREEDYERHSAELLHQIRVNLMYAVNSCYSESER